MFGRNAYGDPARGEGYEHANFLPALRALGHDVHLFDSWDRSLHCDFAALNLALCETVDRLQPDLVLSVLMGYEIWTETLDLLRRAGVAVLNWGTDDSWKYDQFSRHVATHVSTWATTCPEALAAACAGGQRNWVLTQWAANHAVLAEPLPAARCEHAVSFIGSAYGNRRRWVERLQALGVEVACFGHGWPRGAVAAADIPRIMRASVVSLNFGDSGLQLRGLRPYRSRQIKARVFEVPGAGGFLLTEHAQHLDDYFVPDEEIDIFASAEELAGKIRGHLADPARRDRMAQAAHARTAREHTYLARFDALLCVSTRPPASASLDAVRDFASRHAAPRSLRAVRRLVEPAFRLALGERRGPRAARRLLFEASWRLAPRHTYSVAGWPGRLFYDES